jgi:hypothetical protein
MKKFNLGFIPIILLLFSFGCQNTTDPNVTEETKQVSINGSEIYQYQTGISGDEEVATIVQQSKNYETSTIVRDATTDWEAVYHYKPKSGFQGTDYVEVKLVTGSDGSTSDRNIKLINLEITVK